VFCVRITQEPRPGNPPGARKEAAMAVYIIAQINIQDRGEYQKYLDGYDGIFEKYKGMVMTVDEDPVILEGEWPWQRTVLMRFPDEKEARRWFDSDEYTELKKHRLNASEGNIVMVKRGS
jgi:uncharacterized protein (DUF1330 family)